LVNLTFPLDLAGAPSSGALGNSLLEFENTFSSNFIEKQLKKNH